jgi:hypothetical protein
MSSEEDYDEEDEFEEEEEEEEEEERKEQEEEEKEETSEYLNDMKPLYERFRDLLLESTRLSRKLRKAKFNGNESTIEYGRDVLDLIKLRVRVSAVEKLMNGPNHMYGAFSAAFLAYVFVSLFLSLSFNLLMVHTTTYIYIYSDLAIQ